MNVDVVVDDEFQTCQAYTVVRNLREIEGQLGVAHVHHDLQADFRHLAPANFLDLGLDQAIVDPALVAFRAGYGSLVAVLEDVGRRGTSDNGRHAHVPQIGSAACWERVSTYGR